MLWVVAKTSPREFFSQAREAIFTAFGTSSSNATLPTALRVAKEKLQLRPDISQFVLTVGSTANQNGTALFRRRGRFVSGSGFGVELNLYQQVVVVLMSILAGVGYRRCARDRIVSHDCDVMGQVGVPQMYCDHSRVGSNSGHVPNDVECNRRLVLATCVSRNSENKLEPTEPAEPAGPLESATGQ